MHNPAAEANANAQGGDGGAALPAEEGGLSTVPLTGEHDLASFTCKRSGNVEKFLKEDALRWQDVNFTRVFVLPNPNDEKKIWGYYSLSASLIVPKAVDPEVMKDLPSLNIPMALLGFMGRHDDAPVGTGAGLVADAALRISQVRDLGICGVWLNAETEGLVIWYEKVGFVRCPPRKDGAMSMQMYAAISALLE